MVNTTRKLRMAVDVARDAVDGGLVARIGARQLGVLIVGRSEVELAATPPARCTAGGFGRPAAPPCDGIQPVRTT